MEIIARTRTFSREINPNSSASRSRRDKFCSKMLGVLASYLHRITNIIGRGKMLSLIDMCPWEFENPTVINYYAMLNQGAGLFGWSTTPNTTYLR